MNKEILELANKVGLLIHTGEKANLERFYHLAQARALEELKSVVDEDELWPDACWRLAQEKRKLAGVDNPKTNE